MSKSETAERLAAFDMRASADGTVTITERAENLENGMYPTTDLLDNEDHDDVQLTLGIDEDIPAGAISLRLSSYHVRSPSSGKTFHSKIEILLSHEQLRHLHLFTGFLLEAL